MEERNTTKEIIGEVLAEIIEDVKNGCLKKVNVGLMAYGSELGSEELIKGAALAMQNDPSVNVVLIGPKTEGFKQMEWIETPACETDISRAMEDALDKGIIEGAVALHYPFPLGVATIGKVLTPARAKPCFISSSTGTSSSNRVEAMLRNAIYGIAVAKADGIESPTVGILNLDGAQTVLRALQRLNEGGYPIRFGSSMRKDGGAILRGNDLLAGSVDVCVTDTLTGNVLMKLFAAWNTGGNYEALGWGYGPSTGENWSKVISIISRTSGAPVVADAITLNARCVKNGLQATVASELKLAEKAGLDEIIASIQPKQVSSEEEVIAPPTEITDEEINGIDVLEIDDAVKILWKAGIYAESSMGCTGPVIKTAAARIEKAKAVLKDSGYI